MNIKKGMILLIIGAVTFGMMASSVSADDPVLREEVVEIDSETVDWAVTTEWDGDEIHPDMDTTISIDKDDERPWEDQPFWDDSGDAEGDWIIAPNPNTGEDIIPYDASIGEKSLNGADSTGSSGASVLGIVAGILSSVFVILIMKGY